MSDKPTKDRREYMKQYYEKNMHRYKDRVSRRNKLKYILKKKALEEDTFDEYPETIRAEIAKISLLLETITRGEPENAKFWLDKIITKNIPDYNTSFEWTYE